MSSSENSWLLEGDLHLVPAVGNEEDEFLHVAVDGYRDGLAEGLRFDSGLENAPEDLGELVHQILGAVGAQHAYSVPRPEYEPAHVTLWKVLVSR